MNLRWAGSLALALAVMLGLTALAFILPAGAAAQPPGANPMGQLCANCDLQLVVSVPKAAKPDGDKQPLDLSVQLTDENGNPVVGAKVIARATDFETFVDAPLTDLGNGRYAVCAFGTFNGVGAGAVRIHVRADKPGYRQGASDGSNSVGRLCPVPGSGPAR
jgi:hypothetical protein